ncbi:MAG: indole-3-glycerol phosphate synthase TrpC [Victivallales bacterium]|nr:indole-3-glycerol phosphate synthase TrpC [Victivallales bacterium]
MNILEKIMADIRRDLVAEKELHPEADTIARARQMPPCRDFRGAFARPETVRIIAELKKASPSKGLIRERFEPEQLALELESAGAAALSVLTEKNYFLGHQDYLHRVSQRVDIPVLRKDFIFDPYQIYRARVLGADAILLIAAALERNDFARLLRTARELGLGVLSEVHNRDELAMVLDLGVDVVGINCRDLKTFHTDLAVIARMLELIPPGQVAIAESGITGPDDIRQLIAAGAAGFLIGETLMRAEHPGVMLSELIDGARRS